MDTFNEIKIGFSSINIAGIFRVNLSWLKKKMLGRQICQSTISYLDEHDYQ